MDINDEVASLSDEELSSVILDRIATAEYRDDWLNAFMDDFNVIKVEILP